MTRQVGKIKRFGGINRKTGRQNHFGFIARADKEADLFFHRNEARCSFEQLSEGVAVTFELGEDRRELYAVQVDLLENEADPHILADCFHDHAYSLFVARRYLNSLAADQAVAELVKRFTALHEDQHPYWLKHIAAPWLKWPEGEALYAFLPFEQFVAIYKKRLVHAPPEQRMALAEKVIQSAYDRIDKGGKKKTIICQVPRPFLYLAPAKGLRRLFPLQEHLQLCLEILNHRGQLPDQIDLVADEIVARVVQALKVPPSLQQDVTRNLQKILQVDFADLEPIVSTQSSKANLLSAFVRRFHTGILLHQDGRILRRHLDTADILSLCTAAEQKADIATIRMLVSELLSTQVKVFWDDAFPPLAEESFLLTLAPQPIKEKWTANKYQSFSKILIGCIRGTVRDGDVGDLAICAWPTNVLMNDLTQADRKLASLWTPPVTDEKIYQGLVAKMLSARMAEIAAARFYKSLGFRCKDIAITQLAQNGDDWKTHDLLLNGRIPIDVKNARTSYYDQENYVEHCIPRFKQTRDLRDVTITGVLSPYLSYEELNRSGHVDAYRQKKKRKQKGEITVLGEITQDKLARLEAYFSRPDRFELHLKDGGTMPSWVFDFPDQYYRRHQTYRAQLRSYLPANMPSWAEIETLKLNPLPAFVAANAPLPDPWFQSLLPSQQAFYKKLCPPGRGSERISLPFLYLTILIDFLAKVEAGIATTAFSPQDYKILLFRNPKTQTFPLGIVDPLGIIRNLIDSLTILWRANEKHSLKSFRMFKFHGLGLLRGRASLEDEWTTILAYCGGRSPAYGKCGKRPLIYGREETCSSCGRLICPECGFCQQGCHQYLQRLEGDLSPNLRH